MPRIRLKAEQYPPEDFWLEVDRRCHEAGIQGGNNAALARAIGTSDVTVGNYRRDIGRMPVKTLSKIVSVCRPNPGIVLRLLGYSRKEINQYGKELP